MFKSSQQAAEYVSTVPGWVAYRMHPNSLAAKRTGYSYALCRIEDVASYQDYIGEEACEQKDAK